MSEARIEGAARSATSPPVSAEIFFGPRVRKSPFHEATLRYGATSFSVYNHMYLPMSYSRELGRDYWNAVRAVQLWDVACERQVEIRGPDALEFAQRLTPRNLSRIEYGQAAYSLITNSEGGILNDPVMLKLGSDRIWFSLADNDILLWAQALAESGRYQVEVSEPDVSPLQVQGPRSKQLLAGLFGDWLDSLPFYHFREFDFDGIPLLVGRMGYSHLQCFELFLRDAALGEELWERLWRAGKPLGISAGAPITALRLEAGIFSHRTDMDERTNPFEMGLGWTVDLNSELGFMGEASLRALAENPPVRLMRGAEIEGPPIWSGNQEPWPAYIGDHQVGTVTTCSYSPGFEKNLAFVMLDAERAQPDGLLEVTLPDGTRRAKVVKIPWTKRAM